MPSVFDVGLDSDGDWPLIPRHITGTDLTLQRIGIRLGYFLGEWLLNSRTGLPILRWVSEKPFDIERATAEVRQQIETTEGVIGIQAFASSFDGPQQTARFSGRVVLAEETLDFVVAPPSVGSLDNVNQTPMVLFFRSGTIVARF